MEFASTLITELFDRRVQAVRAISRLGMAGASDDVLILPTLKLAEQVLREKFGQVHYELSVWTSREAPTIVAYYDTSRQERPRTDAERERNPTFYREQGYAVIQLLDHPDNEPIIKTRLSPQGYRYHGLQQQEHIKATVLFCFDLARPAAVVITSANPQAFDAEQRVQVVELVRCLSLAIKADLDLIGALKAKNDQASEIAATAEESAATTKTSAAEARIWPLLRSLTVKEAWGLGAALFTVAAAIATGAFKVGQLFPATESTATRATGLLRVLLTPGLER
jgi:hypothetical protein